MRPVIFFTQLCKQKVAQSRVKTADSLIYSFCFDVVERKCNRINVFFVSFSHFGHNE